MFSIEKRDDGSYRAAGSITVVHRRTGGATLIVGYGAVFHDAADPGGTEYQLSAGVRERIAPYAFDRALRDGDDVVGLYNHDGNWLLGRRSAGTLRLSTDKRGLRYEIDYDAADPQHVSVMRKLQRGDLTGSSFSFIPTREKVTNTGSGYLRVVEDVRLIDVGPVWRPAYSSAIAGARGSEREDVWRRLQKIYSDEWREKEREREAVAVRLRLLEIDHAH